MANPKSEGQQQSEISRRQGQVVHLSDSESVVSPALLEECLAVERKRNFRALCWLSSIFLFVILAVSALLLSVGAFILRGSQNALVASELIRDEAGDALASYDEKIDSVETEVQTLNGQTRVLSAKLRAERAAYMGDRRDFRENLVGFRNHYGSKYAGMASVVGSSGLKERLLKLEMDGGELARQFEEMRQFVQENRVKAMVLPMPVGPTEPAGMVSVARSVVGTPYEVDIVVEPAGEQRTIQYDDGSTYDGQVRNGKKHGRGTFAFANGDKYVGDFANGLRHGWGVYIYGSGSRYEGEYRLGKRHGKGAFFYANDDKFEGEWRSGLKDGAGEYTRADGTELSGVWRNDQPVSLD